MFIQANLKIKKVQICYIHRGRNYVLNNFFLPQVEKDYNFDYRGTYKNLNFFFLIIKSFITSLEIKKSDYFLIEGGLHIFCALFLMIKYPKSKFIFNIADPTLYNRNTSLAKIKFLIKTFIIGRFNYFLTNSPMVYSQLSFLYPNKKAFIYRYYLPLIKYSSLNTSFLYKYKKNNLIRIGCAISRPFETGHIKGLDNFINLINFAKRENILNLSFHFCGKDSSNLEHPNLNNHGYIQPIKNFFNKIDILVCPSRYDAYPAIVIEALNNNVVPIVSNFCGNHMDLSVINKNFVVNNLYNYTEWVDKINYFSTYKPTKNEIKKIHKLMLQLTYK